MSVRHTKRALVYHYQLSQPISKVAQHPITQGDALSSMQSAHHPPKHTLGAAQLPTACGGPGHIHPLSVSSQATAQG
jgi:hypothetical protein